MSTKEKSGSFHVGQLLCGGFEGTGVTSQAYHLVVDHHISTVILSKKNAVSVKQMTKLIRDLQYIAYAEAKYKYPLMFAIDEEGGMLNALFDSEFLTQFPGAMALSAIGDTNIVYEVLKALAIELRHIGFQIIFGPVLDVVTKLSHQLVGVRSFGTTVEQVVKNGKACAKGFRDGGLLPFGKHFPGIGNASVDSLLELPMLTDSLEQVKHFNAVPFADLIKENLLDGVCAAGCGVPTISPDEVHSCLSPVIVGQLLRQDIGFDGVVISECLEMDALHHSIGLGQGVILALYAGCDLILVCHDRALQDEAVESMEKALSNGNLDEELVLKSLNRIENLQKRLSSWDELFPNGEGSAKPDEINLFKDFNPKLWDEHQRLSELAYKGSITLVRDYPDVLPITKFLGPGPKTKPKMNGSGTGGNGTGNGTGNDKESSSNHRANNILLLTPLLNPIYLTDGHKDSESKLYNGEDVFRAFGNMLSNHPLNKKSKTPYRVLHTTYTANGLTSLHESLIENSKVVIVLTSEASRNMYQIGIVKYVSILCGASPSSFNNSAAPGQVYSQLSKPLILVATSSPYDFFYNKSIGSAYLCCYDYTNNALKQLASVLMGDYIPEGCIPGEKKYISRTRKRRLTSGSGDNPSRESLTKLKSNSVPKRRWLVDEFDLNRDWESLVTLMKNNNYESVQETNGKYGSINYQDDSFYRGLYTLLSSTRKTQRHFVIRNSSLNILYGILLTWVNDTTGTSTERTGNLMYLLVDKTKRLQSIGKNLHARATRYLIKEKNCTSIALGNPLPLILLPYDSNLVGPHNNRAVSFVNNFGWDVTGNKTKKKHILVLNDLDTWLVPKKIFRELMIVGIRFDICNDPEKLMVLINKNTKLKKGKHKGKKEIGHKGVKTEMASENGVGMNVGVGNEEDGSGGVGAGTGTGASNGNGSGSSSGGGGDIEDEDEEAEDDDEEEEEEEEEGEEEDEDEEDEEDEDLAIANTDKDQASSQEEKALRYQSIKEEKDFIKNIYLEAIKHLNNDSQLGVKIIMALEPTNQKIIGSIILFTNRSELAKFYPFMEEVSEFSTKSSPTDSITSLQADELIGAIIAPVIDPSYSNLTEIFKYGLICSGITFLKSTTTESKLNQCLMIGVNDDKSGNLSGIKDIGFQEWKYYYDYYDKRSDFDSFTNS